jgi:Na+-translocating ferredoxin:NAD+ oxidoreductase RnfE subunit
VVGVPRTEARPITVASAESSLEAFRIGIGVSSALVIIGGLIGAAGIRNPRRVVLAKNCRGGQLAGAPLDAAGVHTTE